MNDGLEERPSRRSADRFEWERVGLREVIMVECPELGAGVGVSI